MSSQLERLQVLHSVIGKLPSGRQTFAHDLMNNFRRFKKLSDKQMEWVEKLIVMATVPNEAAANEAHQRHEQRIPGFACIHDLIYTAAQKIQWPIIRLLTQKGQKVKLYKTQCGRGVVVNVGGTRGNVFQEVMDTTYLRLLPDLADVLNMLHEMAAHPVETAILYGKRTKQCCFCGITLTDPRSRHVGYGPICAENYGLPWGEDGRVQGIDLEELAALMEAQDGKS